ncbi:hypothetical protein [Pseudomonas helvetica]|uniref:hypothetical protein n=1 Tax=Pseudomonas helvetica TaxID=3136738 RepID=UPI003264A642
MVNLEDVKSFVESNRYQTTLLDIKEHLNLDINEGQPSDNLFQYDANKINVANVEIEALERVIDQGKVSLAAFMEAKLSKLKQTAHEQEGNQGEDKIIKVLPFYKNFLIIYLLELYFLEYNPSGLDVYLKGIRIPNSKKYKDQLIAIYTALDN